MTAASGAAKNNIIQKYQNLASQDVLKAVQGAARRTGADFAFLLQKANAESSFNPTAKAKTSSATGLYQFIESTWLNMVKKHGDKFGLGDYAEKIELRNGKAVCTDAGARKDILALRNDPEIAALMAGAFTAENKAHLQKNVKGDIGATELYFAHFMGAGGATKFLNNRAANGEAVAADLFPTAAQANRNVFYDRATGKARTFDEVYAFFDRKFGADTGTGAESRLAAADAAPASRAPSPAKGNSLSAAVLAQLSSPDDTEAAERPARKGDAGSFAASGFSARVNPFGFQRVSPVSILMLAEIQHSLLPNSARTRNA